MRHGERPYRCHQSVRQNLAWNTAGQGQYTTPYLGIFKKSSRARRQERERQPHLGLPFLFDDAGLFLDGDFGHVVALLNGVYHFKAFDDSTKHGMDTVQVFLGTVAYEELASPRILSGMGHG